MNHETLKRINNPVFTYLVNRLSEETRKEKLEDEMQKTDL
jgi:hypothetical protein